jgi:hypothetical protein
VVWEIYGIEDNTIIGMSRPPVSPISRRSSAGIVCLKNTETGRKLRKASIGFRQTGIEGWLDSRATNHDATNLCAVQIKSVDQGC